MDDSASLEVQSEFVQVSNCTPSSATLAHSESPGTEATARAFTLPIALVELVFVVVGIVKYYAALAFGSPYSFGTLPTTMTELSHG